jgi:Ser-tRNA(Ala) deacylase AlaX
LLLKAFVPTAPAPSTPVALVLSRSCAHPQGGGQPGDKGVIIIGETAVLAFVTARWGAAPLLDAAVVHMGWFLNEDQSARARADPLAAAAAVGACGDGAAPAGSLAADAGVALLDSLASTAPPPACSVHVDVAWRRACAELHSAGHLLDAAVALALPALAATLLPAGEAAPTLRGGKGNHFPGGAASVEYVGSLPPAILAAFPEAVNAHVAALLEADAPTRVVLLPSKEELPAAIAAGEIDGMDGVVASALDLEHFPAQKPLRLVAVGGANNVCPCGGTHVKHVKQLKGLVVTKATSKKGVTKLSYGFKA